MEYHTNWKNIIRFAGAYIACAIGSGFSTGQEIMQFFSVWGKNSIKASIISLVIFAWFGGIVMENGRKLNLKTSSSVIPYYLGNHLGKYVNYYTNFFLFAAFTIMIAGASATLNEYYGLSPLVGRIFMASISLFTVVLGVSKLIMILGIIGPIIICFSLAVGTISLIYNVDGFHSAEMILETIVVPSATDHWVKGGILYPAYNVIAVILFLTRIGASAKTSKETILGGILGGFFLMLAAIIINFALLANIDSVFNKEVPILFLANKISPILGIIFCIVLLCGIYSSAVPMLWALCNSFSKEKTWKFYILAFIITVFAFCFSKFSFKKLVASIYPFTGYVGIILMLGIFYKTFIHVDHFKYIYKK